jgi:hypothetical protein
MSIWNWNWTILAALALIAGGALYVHFRWRRSPQAYRAMLGLAGCYFVAGLMTGVWILHLTAKNPSGVRPAAEPTLASVAIPSASAPMIKESAPIPPLYDPAHAVLPDAKLTPGDTFPGVTTGEVCTPGWSREHRHVTEEMRDQVYAEYGRTRGPDCCEVDHLIPLELGGSNDMKNLWPEPEEPRPGWSEKDQLENELHAEVSAGKMPLADAQRGIAANWVQCWEIHVMPAHRAAAG